MHRQEFSMKHSTNKFSHYTVRNEHFSLLSMKWKTSNELGSLKCSLTGCFQHMNIICRGTHFSAGICLTLWMGILLAFLFPAEQIASDEGNGAKEIKVCACEVPALQNWLSSQHISSFPGQGIAWKSLLVSDSSALPCPPSFSSYTKPQGQGRYSFTLYFWIIAGAWNNSSTK